MIFELATYEWNGSSLAGARGVVPVAAIVATRLGCRAIRRSRQQLSTWVGNFVLPESSKTLYTKSTPA